MVSHAIPAVILLVALIPSGAPRCLQEVSTKRFFNYEGEVQQIKLEEVLGYPYVEVVEKDDYFAAMDVLSRLSGPDGETKILVPNTTVSLEVWVSPVIDATILTGNGHVEEVGMIAPPGRFYCEERFCINGSYVPPQCQSSPQMPCGFLFAGYPEYTAFVVRQIEELGLYVRVAWVGPNLKELVENLTDIYVHGSGMNPSTPFGQVSERGAQQADADYLTIPDTAHSIAILTWTPGEIVYEIENDLNQLQGGRNKLNENKPSKNKKASSKREYVSIALPPCESVPSFIDVGCKYDLHRLVKVVWSGLKKGASMAYRAIHLVSFSAEEYGDLLMRYGNRQFDGGFKNETELACDWLKSKRNVWRNWIPHSDKQKIPLYIGGVFPMSGTKYTQRGVVIAATMATEAINNNDTVLRDYSLKLHVYDDQCKSDMVMKSFIEYIRLDDFNRFVGILGPACSDTVEPLAGVSRHFKTVVISYSAEGSSFSDRKKYPYFYRTIGENKQYRHVYLKLFKELGWSRVAALTEDGQKYTEYISHLQDLLQANGIHFVSNRKFPRDRAAAAMSQYLLDLKNKNARIIIADIYDDAARSVMCEAYHLKMTAYNGYVWFLPSWLSPLWYDTESYDASISTLVGKNGNDNDTLSSKSEVGREQVRCNKTQMLEAINGHLSITHAYFAPENEMMQEGLSIGAWKKQYAKKCKDNNNVSVSNYAGYAYDAVWTYALALDALIAENQSHVSNLHSEDTAREFVNQINQIDFNGVSGRIRFVGGPSRISVINVMQWLNNSTHLVGSFYPNVSEEKGDVIDGNLILSEQIVWLSGSVPLDGSNPPRVCVLEGLANLLDVSCEVAIVVANVIGFGFVAILIFAAFIVMKRRYDKKVQMQQKYMKSLGLDLLSASNMHSLDKWEIPRDRVVINRKLGEGAFGTVYGGEADFDERGWVAVAVKTLKVGSNTEEKLDFLSEAEVMKRFDHKNIVKLLGVCTKSEPVYTVMEFMLYGDLKTYLLARRHLVSEKNAEESDEISSKKLTNMALDVARGLSYLAELKYVHRDIASRNCLINASRVVKIGDFGMTRPMYENDYYKFNRKGMLPVRWMAPESLGLGVFTPMSDVWSYGVFLYELITFGSFPFQGMSNNQVLEHVKSGNILNIPVGVKPQLEALIRSCWNLESKNRPQASEIVDFLANNPRLISPCLDCPLASVQMEHSDQLDMNLSERLRKCSMSLNSATGNATSGVSLRHRTPLERPEMPETTYSSGVNGAASLGEESGIALDIEQQNTSSAQLLDNGCVREPLLGENFRSPVPSSSVCLTKYVPLQRSGGNSVDLKKTPLSATSIL
ncbi:hypothetical protein J437_LFUL002585 [Ladona fulva]|uniref:Gamma-aminobutyric acid type B receptor subunit 2 n=1 Tax=Ladona fulva TaxID=123851 RepID=A0A8K0JUA6_LADFU|nr:hypothetical protein J437_LFUL002585 [Ladona fulva]